MGFSKDIRRDQIITAVLKLIGECGMDCLTTAAIAKEVGISEANIYRHFQNKQEVLAETVKRIGEGLRRNVETVMESSSGPLDRLRQIFQLHLRYIHQNPGIPRLLFSDDIHANSSDIKPRLFETISAYADSLEAIVQQGIEDREIGNSIDARATALTFIGMIQISIIRWILSGFKFSIEDQGMALWSNFETCIRHSADNE